MNILREKDVKGYEDIYRVSVEGDVYSFHKERYKLKPYTNNKHGFLTVRLVVKGDAVVHYVHKLVAEAFLPNPNGYKEVRFKDGNKLNVHLSNLEWYADADISSLPDGCTWVKGFEGRYYFDSNRDIFSREGGKLSTRKHHKTVCVQLMKNGKYSDFPVDRLLEKTFFS